MEERICKLLTKKMCVIVILVLVIIESCTLFLMYKSYGNKNTNLDEVKKWGGGSLWLIVNEDVKINKRVLHKYTLSSY